MSLGERIVGAIEKHWERKRRQISGALGDFYRGGGNAQLYDLPVVTDDWVIDAGGYEGEWTANVLVRYGCRSEVFEPVPVYANHCKRLFGNNSLVRVHAAALGGFSRVAKFSVASTGTSEFVTNGSGEAIHVEVIDIHEFLEELDCETVACLKLNIEGGEYEVLERLLDSKQIDRFKSLLIQFHRQPEGWEVRRSKIAHRLRATHEQKWCYPMVWELWVRLNYTY